MVADQKNVATQDALSPQEIQAKAEAVGVAKANMPLGRAFLLAVLAGVFIGLGGMLYMVVKADSSLSFGVSSLLSGFAFSFGLVFVIVAGAELFTGNNLMIQGCLSGKYGWGRLLRSWVVVYAGNLVGSLLLVALLYLAKFPSQGSGAVGEAMVSVAATKCGLSFGTAFFRGIACNMLVCLAVWMSFGAHSTVDKMVSAMLPVSMFVACGFEHCVANMFFLPMGMLVAASGVVPAGVDVAAISASSIAQNLCAATLGNLVGGALVVGCGYWLALARR